MSSTSVAAVNDANVLVDRFGAPATALGLVVAPAGCGGAAALAAHFDDVPGASVAAQLDALSGVDVDPGWPQLSRAIRVSPVYRVKSTRVAAAEPRDPGFPGIPGQVDPGGRPRDAGLGTLCDLHRGDHPCGQPGDEGDGRGWYYSRGC